MTFRTIKFPQKSNRSFDTAPPFELIPSQGAYGPFDQEIGDTAGTGAVTLIQRFGGALNLNVHFHMLWQMVMFEKAC